MLEEINNFSMRITGSANAMAITIMEETKKFIAKIVDEQPNAYDVDKVVEKFNRVSIPEDKVLYASPAEHTGRKPERAAGWQQAMCDVARITVS